MHRCLHIEWSDLDRSRSCNNNCRTSCESCNDFITINVSGKKYETLKTTLDRFPETLLGNKIKRSFFFVKSKNCYFFDRNIWCFESILFYYQSNGILGRWLKKYFFIFEFKSGSLNVYYLKWGSVIFNLWATLL